MIIGLFKKENFSIENNPKNAEIIVINTCGFIETAKKEAIDTILEMAKYKENEKCKYLIVTGCLVKRYKNELEKSLPEVDLFISPDEYNDLWKKVLKLIKDSKKTENKLDYMDRVISTGNKTAYLKIAEGCSNNCTYCAIPSIRGPFVSREMGAILREAQWLADQGYEEIIVIAQDTTKYGVDLYGEPKLAELLGKLCKLDGPKWIRFLYAYPESITDELIQVVKNNEKICKYFDIPIQHFSDKILKRMNRKSDSKSIENTINKIRKEIPDAIIRTTMIVGFPSETEEEFNELLEFIKRAKFEKLGAFQYSKEDGTPASRMQEQIHYKTKQRRWNILMNTQKEISEQKLKQKIGKTYTVLVDGFTNDGKYIIARSYMDIPDEDGVIFIKNDSNVKLGEFIKCKITDVNQYDLVGEIL